ncbi:MULTISPECIES: HAD-IA family hydrolase [Halomonas]|uniref:HAD-IA family hydrolase n=1 Tax=Halomonas TaxID=2745 RepID=UPI001A8C91C3|nr:MULTISPECIES: HAD-IA family hydrolase [Halomonas]MBN8413052.1 HAD-IA family hydrolase [Halomonas litopenaei]MBY5925348.1 HAD-IA family hydrolase [Halomonas sp. DP4Y7-2]MBY6232389.1 HAD-IA family hydrolase [Halomonas sp. DP4Y7-1]MED5297050.1 HAD-IA family hydrolase [Pseudomonadota bacterium]
MSQTQPPLCLLFDSDGTLVDSEPLLARAMADTFPPFGLPFSAEQYMEEFRGVRFLDIVQELERRFGSLADDQRQIMEDRLRANMAERMEQELVPIAGIPQALDALADHPKAVASNGPIAKIRLAMATTGLAPHFGDHLFSAYELGVWKPDPGLYLAAAEAMGVSPEHCVVIDDAAVGVEAGLKAGMQVIHINHFPEEEDTPEGAVGITHADQLVDTIERLAAKATM